MSRHIITVDVTHHGATAALQRIINLLDYAATGYGVRSFTYRVEPADEVTTLGQAWEEGFHALDDSTNPYEQTSITDEESDRLGVLILCALILLVVAGAVAAAYFNVGGVK